MGRTHILPVESFNEKLNALKEALDKSKSQMQDISDLILVSHEGLPITATISNYDDMRKIMIAAMAASTSHQATLINTELNKGELNYIVLKGSEGLIIVTQVSNEAVLLCLTLREDNLREILLEMTRISRKVAEIGIPHHNNQI